MKASEAREQAFKNKAAIAATYERRQMQAVTDAIEQAVLCGERECWVSMHDVIEKDFVVFCLRRDGYEVWIDGSQMKVWW